MNEMSNDRKSTAIDEIWSRASAISVAMRCGPPEYDFDDVVDLIKEAGDAVRRYEALSPPPSSEA